METLNAFKGNIPTRFSWTLLLPLNSLGIEEKYPIREIFMEGIPCSYVLEEHGAFIIQFHLNYVPANCSALPTPQVRECKLIFTFTNQNNPTAQ